MNNKQSSVDKEFVPYEEALALKELGFNEPCFGFWNYNDSKMYYWNDEEIQNERTNTWFLDTEKKFPKISKNGCTAPTFSQAFRWIREEYGMCGYVSPLEDISAFYYMIYTNINKSYANRICSLPDRWKTCEEAELACLKQLIEMVKQGGNK